MVSAPEIVATEKLNFESHVDHDPQNTLLGLRSAPASEDCQPLSGCPGLVPYTSCECDVCYASTWKKLRNAFCRGVSCEAIYKYAPWCEIHSWPLRLYLVWTGFCHPTRYDRSIMAELDEIYLASSSEAWEHFMTTWRHLARMTENLPPSSNQSPFGPHLIN